MPDNASITAAEARDLFAPYANAPALMLAVSGGPDSMALLHLTAEWRAARESGPELHVATVDHRLRAESATEAALVARVGDDLGLPHRTLIWAGDKPATGVPAAARDARYRLLREAALRSGATHILTAHTQDDQAETVLMRLIRGSGISGLKAMARETDLGGVVLARPLLDVPKARLLATVKTAGLAFASDPTNHDSHYLRPRLRALLPRLADEGLDAAGLGRLARRMARADAALEATTSAAEATLAHPDGWDLGHFNALPFEIRVRLLIRAIRGLAGEPELAQVEALIDAVAAGTAPLSRTLAGALISSRQGRLSITPAPPRRTPHS